MSQNRNGWITARSQISFVIGLVLAVGVIFWLELVQFRNADDPSGDGWVVTVDLPSPRGLLTEAPDWFAAALTIVAEGNDPVATALVAAACRGLASCAPAPEAVTMALLELAASPAAWDDAPAGPASLAALSALLGAADDREAVSAWAVAREAAGQMAASSITSEHGLRQFAARAATLAGRDFAAARRLTDLRDVFEPADGLQRMGATRSANLALGLGLLDATFPDTGAVRQLLWQTFSEWPFALADTPVSVVALWWSAFSIEGLDSELDIRLAMATPLEAAFVILAATSAGRGPLLTVGR